MAEVMSSDDERRAARHCLPGCDRLDGHDGRDPGACMRDGGVLTPDPLECTGIFAYDLEPPCRPSPPVPAWLPFRHPGQAAPRTRYVPPALPGGFARVELDDDYYLGPQWSGWSGDEAEYPARVFDIPSEQQARWQQAQEAYQAMQEEIGALLASRRGQVPEGWERKPPYQPQP